MNARKTLLLSGFGLLLLLGILISVWLPGGAAGKPASASLAPVTITVVAPAGPAPMGAPVETSVPFAKGQLRQVSGLVILSPGNKAMPAQFQTSLLWPDRSVRWLTVIFEADEGPGKYRLQSGLTPPAAELLQETAEGVVLDTGKTFLTVPTRGDTLFGRLVPTAVKHNPDQGLPGPTDLVLTRYDGKLFEASLAGESRKLIVEEKGPIRASLRLEGQCRAQDGEGLFNYIIRLQAYRSRPEIWLTVTWINATDKDSEQLRDIRLKFPYRFRPDRLVFGCDPGVYDGPWLSGWSVDILQDDYNRYRAKTTNPLGRPLNLSTGGCNGEHFPGWLYLEQGRRASLGIYLPNFWQEYPNEFYLRDGELEVSLWPAGAAQHLLSKDILPSNPDGVPYVHFRYAPILPHPYFAFFDKDKQCLDVPKGVAKTQQLLLSVSAEGGNLFEKKYWQGALQPVRGFVDPEQVAKSDGSRVDHLI